MNKKRTIIAIIAILLIMLAIFLGEKTYAKYTSQVRQTGKADIATWDFKVNGTDGDYVEEKIDLGQTVDETTLVNNKIAPGTKGSFIINIDASESEVGLKYEIYSHAQINQPQNLRFIYNGEKYINLQDVLNQLTGYIYANDSNKTRQLEIEWEWPYQTQTTDDNIIQEDHLDRLAQIGKEFQFDIYVRGTQINPNE